MTCYEVRNPYVFIKKDFPHPGSPNLLPIAHK